MALEYGINFNTETGRKKAEAEILKWKKELQKKLDSDKLNINVDAKKMSQDADGASKKVKAISAQIAELRKQFRELEFGEKLKTEGNEIIAQYKALRDKAGIYAQTLDSAAKSQDKMASKAFTDKIKALSDAWNKLTLTQRKGSEGKALIVEFTKLTDSAGRYAGSLSQAAKAQNAVVASKTVRDSLNELTAKWDALTIAQRKGAQGREVIESFKKMTNAAGVYIGSIRDVIAEQERLAKSKTPKGQLIELEQQWETLTIEQRRGAQGRLILDNYKKITESAGVHLGTIQDVLNEEKRIAQEAEKKKKIQQETTPAIESQTSAMRRQSEVMNQLKSYAMNFLSVYAGIRMIKNLATISGEFEMQKVSMQAILRDAEKGAAIFERIKELAVTSPFQFKDLISYTKQLSAFSVPYEDLYNTTKMLADLSAGLGVGMDRLILAYGQVRSAAVLRGQELRQFTEAGIPIVEELRQKLSEANGELVTTGEVFEYISARKVPFEMVRDILTEMTSEGGKFYKMQEVQAETLKGKISNLTDAFEIMMANIGESDGGLMKGAVDGVRALVENYETVGRVLLSLVATYGIYKAAVIANTVVENGFRASQLKGLRIVKALTAAQAALNKVMLLNPYVLVAAGIALLGVGLWNLAKATDASKRAQEAFNEQAVKNAESVDEERREIQRLIDLIKDETQTRATKQRALSTLQSMYPSIFNNMDIEAVKIKDLAELMGLYNKELDKNTKLRTKQSIAEAERILRDGDFSGSQRGRANKKSALSIMGMEANEWNLATWNARNLEERFRKYTDLLKSADRERLINEFNSKTDAQRVVYIDQRIEALKREKDALESQSESQWGGLSPEEWKRTSESIQKEIDSLNNKRKELLSTNQAEVITADKLIAQYNRLTESIRSQQELLRKGATDEDSVRELQEQQAKVADSLKLMGIDMSPDKDTSDKAKKEAEKRTKEYLDAIQSQVDEYKKKFDIWNTIYEGSGKKPAMDFDITFNGEPDVSKYIKSKMQEIGGGKLNLDVDFLTADFSDILNGAVFDDQTIDRLKSLFKELQDSSFSDYKGLTELYAKYADYTVKKTNLDKKYIEERNKLLGSNADEAILKEQLRVYREESDKLVMEFAEKDQAFNDFVSSIANKSVDRLRFLLMELQASLTKETVTGGDNETILMLRAKISALEEQLKNAKIDKGDAKDISSSYKQWKNLQSVLSKVGREFDEIGEAVGGTAGEIISLAGDISTSTMAMINGIVLLANWSTQAIKMTAEGTAKAIQSVEKASVILAVISAALQIATKIWEFISRTNEISEERIQQYRAFIDVTNEVVDAQKKLIKTMSGAEARKEQEETLKVLEKQRDAAINLGKEYLTSGGSLFKRSYGRRMSQDLKEYADDLAKIGVSYSGLGTYFKGLFDLPVEKLAEIKKYVPEFWAKLTPELRDYLEQVIEIDEATKELWQTTKEAVTGIEFDDLLSGFDDFIEAADDGAAALAENFESYMLQAIMNIVKTQYLTDELERWYKQMESAFGNDTLTEAEKEALRKEYERIMTEGERRLNTALDVAGLKRDSTTNLTGISKGVSTITEDTALVLGGYLNSIRHRLFEYRDFMMLPENRPAMAQLIQSQIEAITYLQRIDINTKVTADTNTNLLDNINKMMVSSPDGWRLRVDA